MRTKMKSLIGVSICAMALLAAIGLAYAGASLWTTDTQGNVKTVFYYEDTVRINWYVSVSKQVDIKVTYYQSEADYEDDNNGELHFELKDQDPKGTYDFVPGKIGVYAIECTFAGKTKVIASGYITTIPENLLGTLMATAAGFAAFGAFRYSRSKRSKR